MTPGQLKAELSRVLDERPACRLVAWSCHAPYEGPPELEVQGHRFEVVSPRSPLEFHELALQAEHGQRRLALLVGLDPHELSNDLLRRLPGRNLLSLDAWNAVKQRFRASDVDPRLRREKDLAPLLLEAEPPEGFAPALGGALTLEHAFSYLLPHLYRLPPDADDPLRMLRWALRSDLERLPPAPLEPLTNLLVIKLGPLARPWLAVLRQARRDLVPLGMVCEALFADDALNTPVQAAAAARLEGRVGGEPLSPTAARSWARFALQALQAEELHEPGVATAVLSRAESLLQELGGSELARYSTVLPSGFEQRLEALARDPRPSLLAPVHEHRQARFEPERAERATLALRLAAWLEQPDSPSGPELERQLAWYLDSGLFVDRCRDRIYRGDPQPAFNQLCRDLFSRATTRRQETNHSFALALQGWHLAPAGLLGVENLLDQVLAPLTRKTRVLLLVLDGCSQAVLSELLEDLPSTGLASYRHERLTAMLSLLPSVTEYSRTSLLSGQVARGDADSEHRSFTQHPRLREACRKDSPPCLFHRREVLDSQGGLTDDLVRKVESSAHKLVGVVLNAIDDTLAKDDQLELRWRLSTIRPLASLVTLAQRSERAVLLVSDHGHILEQGTRAETGREGGGERWCQPEGAPGPDWMDFSGPRLPHPARLAVTESVRLGPRKNGYHGGATPQEVVCALRLLAPPGLELEGWRESLEPRPTWWELSRPALLSEPVAPPPPRPASPQLTLFETPATVGQSLTTRLLDSPLFRQRCKEHGVSVTGLAPLEGLLEQLTRLAPPVPLRLLAQQLDLTESRLKDRLTLAARLLNLDGYATLVIEPESVTLDRRRLEEVFELTSSSAPPLVLTDRTGRRLELRLPLELKDLERKLLELVARHGRMSEAELVKASGSKRSPGQLADLCSRLHAAGWTHLTREGSGEQGEIYRLIL